MRAGIALILCLAACSPQGPDLVLDGERMTPLGLEPIPITPAKARALLHGKRRWVNIRVRPGTPYRSWRIVRQALAETPGVPGVILRFEGSETAQSISRSSPPMDRGWVEVYVCADQNLMRTVQHIQSPMIHQTAIEQSLGPGQVVVEECFAEVDANFGNPIQLENPPDFSRIMRSVERYEPSFVLLDVDDRVPFRIFWRLLESGRNLKLEVAESD